MAASLDPHENGSLDPAVGENAIELRDALQKALHATQATIRDTTRLTRLFTILSEPAPLELMLDRVLSTLSELFAADIVVLLDPVGTGACSPLAAIGLPEEMLHLPMWSGNDGNSAMVMATRLPRFNLRVSTDPAVEPQLRDLGAEVAVWVPVADSHIARGVLILARCRPAPFDHADVDLLVAMAYRIGLALDQVQHSVQLARIVQMGRDIGRHLDESEVCRTAMKMFSDVLWVDAAALVLMGPGDAPQCVNPVGLDSVWNSTWQRLTEHLVDASSLRNGQPYSTSELGRTAEWRSLALSVECPVRSLLAVPIQREGLMQGVLYAMRFSPFPPNRDTIQMAMLCAGQISAAMENARLYRLVHEEFAERMQTEQQLREMEQQKQQIWRVESLNRMAGGIAHHFNNQLMVAMGNLELALTDLPEDTAVRPQLISAMNACARVTEISHLMLAYVGQVRPKKRPLDLAETVREVLPLLIASLPDNVHLRSDPQCPGPVVLADGVHIRQILSNLLVNAAEATGEVGGEITLTVDRVTKDEIRASRLFPVDWAPQAEHYASIAVSDAGCGLDDAGLEKIFDPFYSTKLTGRGLGLPVALGLVRAHDGAIAVESRLGGGATFRLLFPLTPQEFPSRRKEETSALALPGGGRLVLVVDDEPMLRILLHGLLIKLGYRVLEASDGLDAVETFQARRDDICLVILDVSMPRMNGWEALTILRAMRPGIPVLLTSGYDEEQVMRGDHPEWPQAFLHKPYGVKELKAALGTVRMACPAL